MSVCPSAWHNSAPTARIFMKFDIWEVFENLLRNFKFNSNPTRITATVREDQQTFLIISRSVLLRMRNVSDKSWRGKQNTHFLASNFFFFRKSCRLWDNVGKMLLSGPGHRWQYWCFSIALGYLRLQTHTLRLCNIYRFSTAATVGQTLLIFMLYVHCLSLCVLSIFCMHWNNVILWMAVRDGSISVESVPSNIDNHFLLQSEIYRNNK